MKQLGIKTGYACNNNCVFCLNQKKKGYKRFSLDLLLQQIKMSAKEGARQLIISGGEPLISPYFFTLIRFARDNGFRIIEIQTNARMLYYQEFLEKLLKVQPVHYAFLVSLHFPFADMHNKYSRAEGFDQTIAGIKNLVKFKLQFKINTVVMKQNLDLLGKVTSLLCSLGAEQHQFRMIDGKNVRENFYEFVPEMNEVSEKVRKVIADHSSHIDISVHEIPLCILGSDLKKHISPPANSQRENLVIGNKTLMSPEIIKKQFIFPRCCEKCDFRSLCLGIRKNYSEFYGFSELTPIQNGTFN